MLKTCGGQGNRCRLASQPATDFHLLIGVNEPTRLCDVATFTTISNVRVKEFIRDNIPQRGRDAQGVIDGEVV
jgi:hypothetical protein